MDKEKAMWKKSEIIDENAGFASPDECIAEYTAYYDGLDGALVAESFYVKEHLATETNMPYDANENYPLNEDGEQVLYSVEESTWFTPSDDPDDDDSEYGEGSALWYWTLDAAKKEARRLAETDTADMILWDGLAVSLNKA
jgi:hypothetical protein